MGERCSPESCCKTKHCSDFSEEDRQRIFRIFVRNWTGVSVKSVQQISPTYVRVT